MVTVGLKKKCVISTYDFAVQGFVPMLYDVLLKYFAENLLLFQIIKMYKIWKNGGIGMGNNRCPQKGI